MLICWCVNLEANLRPLGKHLTFAKFLPTVGLATGKSPGAPDGQCGLVIRAHLRLGQIFEVSCVTLSHCRQAHDCIFK